VPGIVLLTLAAVPVARLASVVNVRRALLAGAACGAAASVIQLGHLLAAAGAVLLVGRLRRRCAWPLAAFGAAHAAVLGGVALALDSTGVVLTLPGASDLLGVPRSTIGDFTLRRFAELFPEFVELWIFAEPMAAAGVMILTWSCVKPSAERSGRRTTAAVYGLYPAILFVALGTTYSAPRYSLSATPFLAILAAEGILTIRGAGARRILAGLAVAVPLSLSLRYDALLDAPDTRVLLRAIVRQVHASDPSVVVEANLLSSEHAEGGRIRVFPPDWDYRIWSPGRRETPLETLTKMDAGVYIQNRMRWRAQSVTAEELRGLGYRLSRVVEGSPPGESSLPDAPDRIAIDLWRSERCGPTLELWTRGERSRSAVDAALDPR
jgi:hypothetical protein